MTPLDDKIMATRLGDMEMAMRWRCRCRWRWRRSFKCMWLAGWLETMETATAMANGVDNEVRQSHVWVQQQQLQQQLQQQQQHAQRQHLAPHWFRLAIMQPKIGVSCCCCLPASLHVSQLMRMGIGTRGMVVGGWFGGKVCADRVASKWKWSSDLYAMNIAPTLPSSFGCCQLHLHFLASSGCCAAVVACNLQQCFFLLLLESVAGRKLVYPAEFVSTIPFRRPLLFARRHFTIFPFVFLSVSRKKCKDSAKNSQVSYQQSQKQSSQPEPNKNRLLSKELKHGQAIWRSQDKVQGISALFKPLAENFEL